MCSINVYIFHQLSSDASSARRAVEAEAVAQRAVAGDRRSSGQCVLYVFWKTLWMYSKE